MSGATADGPAAVDVEKAGEASGGDAGASGGGGAVGAIVGRWRRQDLLDKSGSALRAAAWALSLLAFLIMVCNEHGDWKQFDRYEEYRCASLAGHCLAVRAVLDPFAPINACGGCVACERD
jgi:hypothetical protein